MNNKGNFPDVVEWIRFSLAFVLVVGITLAFITQWDSTIQSANSSIVPNVSKAASTSLKSSVTNGLDYLYIAVFIMFTAFSVMAARLIPSSPKFIIVTIMALIMLPLGAMFVENVWDGFSSNTTISNVFGSMVFLPFMMDYLRYFVLFYSLVVGISLLSKEGVVYV